MKRSSLHFLSGSTNECLSPMTFSYGLSSAMSA